MSIINKRRKEQCGWKSETLGDLAIKWFCFIVSPILGLLYSLKNLKTKSSFYIIYLVGILFGLSITVEPILGSALATEYSDSMYHRATFEAVHDSDSSILLMQLAAYFTGEGEKDIFAFLIKFLVSRITDNYHVFFFIIAVIYAFFSIKCLKIFVIESRFDNSMICLMLVYLFLSAQIIEVNGVRFFTAGWVVTYGLINYFLLNKNKYLIYLVLAPLIHSAFLVFGLIFAIYLILKRFPNICVILLVVSFVASEIFIQLVSTNLSLVPDFLKDMVEGYVYGEVKSKGVLFDIFAIAHRLYANILVLVLVVANNKHYIKDKTYGMYTFVILLAAFSNFFMSIPTLGNRFQVLLFPFIAYIWLVNLYKTRYDKFLYLIPAVYFYSMFYYLPRTYMKLLEPCFFYSSPIYLVGKYLLMY